MDRTTKQGGMARGEGALLPMLVLALVAALVLTVRVEELRLAAQRRRAAAALLVEVNRSASRDTTRNVALENARVARLLGDSLRVVEKQVVQVAQRRDVLDAALGRERAARYAATAVVDSLSRVVAASDSVVRDARDASRETRTARFDVRQPPYGIAAEVELPPPPDSATMRVRVAVDAIPIEARVSCIDGPGGAREATVAVETPSWVTVRLGTVAQSPDVCTPAPLATSMRQRAWIETRRLVIGVGRAWGTDRRGRWAMFAGAGFAL
jgi:hypothetical protein